MTIKGPYEVKPAHVTQDLRLKGIKFLVVGWSCEDKCNEVLVGYFCDENIAHAVAGALNSVATGCKWCEQMVMVSVDSKYHFIDGMGDVPCELFKED